MKDKLAAALILTSALSLGYEPYEFRARQRKNPPLTPKQQRAREATKRQRNARKNSRKNK
jgi:hypothetical protein